MSNKTSNAVTTITSAQQNNIAHTYMAIDYGLKRVGIALSDASTHFVFPLCTLDRSVKSIFYENLQKLVDAHSPTAFVLGLPFHEDGSECITTVQVRNFAVSLTRRYTLPIFFMDEFLSSFEAEEDLRMLTKQGHKKMNAKKIKELVDQQAAVRILTSFIEHNHIA